MVASLGEDAFGEIGSALGGVKTEFRAAMADALCDDAEFTLGGVLGEEA